MQYHDHWHLYHIRFAKWLSQIILILHWIRTPFHLKTHPPSLISPLSALIPQISPHRPIPALVATIIKAHCLLYHISLQQEATLNWPNPSSWASCAQFTSIFHLTLYHYNHPVMKQNQSYLTAPSIFSLKISTPHHPFFSPKNKKMT